MSQLRSLAGETPIPLTTVETIESMIRRGELPSHGVCPVTYSIPERTVMFHINCEEPWMQGRGPVPTWVTFLSTALFGGIGYLIASRKTDDREIFGREVAVDVPLLVSSQALERVLEMRNQRALKKLLRSVPIYDKLFKEYPKAFVSVLTERDSSHT